jgi:hypothetical protein
MAAPSFAPVSPTDQPRGYAPTPHVPDAWMPSRPGELAGPQPRGAGLGSQGPDQGYALLLADRLRGTLRLQPGEGRDDAVRGCVGVALRRASLYGRAPVIHDLRIAFTIWGFFDDEPPGELVALRRAMFEGVGLVAHHYGEARAIVDMVPGATLRMTPDEVASTYPARWRELLGL